MNLNNLDGYEDSNRTLNNSLNYPTQKALSPSLKNMNYQDFLSITEREQPEALASGNTAINTVVSVTGATLSALGVPGASFITNFYLKIAGLLWPENGKIWDEFMTEVEALIDQKIEEYVRNKAIAELDGLGSALDKYQKALADWLGKQDDPEAILSVATEFRIIDSLFEFSMPSFKVTGYEIPLLTVYAQAANLHLALLRDSTLYGDKWGFTQNNIEENYNRQKKRISEYSDHCTKWYNSGLSRLNGSTYEQWINYNRFRREMILMALDLVAVFPFHDPRRYSMETSTQLTREVYTDPVSLSISNPDIGPSFSQMENTAIRTPHLVDYLDELYIYTSKYKAFSHEIQPDLFYWSAHKVSFKKSEQSNLYTTGIYGKTSGYISSGAYSFHGNDIYRTLAAPSVVVYPYTQNYGVEQVEFYGVKGHVHYRGDNKYDLTYDSIDQLPPDGEPIHEKYTHRLCHATAIFKSTPDYDNATIPIFSWTHRSAEYYNRIYPNKITKIPAVKMYKLDDPSTVVKGPGFTGGDLVKRGSTGYIGDIKATVNSPLSQKYRVRVRYATNVSGQFNVYINDKITLQTKFQNTVETIGEGKDLTYGSFGYIEYSTTIQFPDEHPKITLHLSDLSNNSSFYVDSIEFIPVDVNYAEKEKLEKAQKAVNTLFTEGRNALQKDVTDYKVDQVSILVDCISGDLYPNEKRELQNLVKYAKRLSYSRNLLLDPTFDSINSSEENGWYGSNGIVIGNGDFVFKGNYLIFSGTNDTQYPTYLYQKIDESKLKEYTRYKLKGFIESSQDLEAYVIRYDAKHRTLDVSDNLLPDILPENTCGEPNRCAAQQYLDENPSPECSSMQDGILSDSHSFSLNIDTGSINHNENLGIWVLFKISTLEGYAKFGNLEVIEDGPVIGEALARVKRQETKWRNKLAQLTTETQAIYTRAKQALDNLFANAQDSHLKRDVTFAEIAAARKIVQSIREAYMSWLSVVPGVNHPIFTELSGRVQRAFQLYDVRNVVRNGRFLNGLSDWIVTSDVKVQEENGNNVLVLNNWDAQVLQNVKLYQDRGYILHVTARKIGIGEGYITITDEEGHTDQLRFTACEEIDASNAFISGYITKELEFFPDTEKVHIEIGETEGIFLVESIELFLMEELC
uniref:Pesticidal crystal protein Cry7Aa n=1 Tax=Bacillus thuringiensis TaxID=1428 RepID=CR7AA_BACTU|nr:RecName: Full=Pesticidal crystal protein Cry7Aa; AltName: Full=129 kDa crystal protein; AltName: Full=Crystaline entomocidal protoxin; AltName: Full=Insecticidal delta-endotoxin CryVIIA(a) [Bacillus thuringiensis]AAA22351.1 crystal protein [Bacillus thuringiensis serovar galleriae]